MLGWLEKIWCACIGIASKVGVVIVEFVVNPLIAALGVIAAAACAVLPSMPATPTPPDGGVLNALNWLMPLGQILTAFSGLLVLWLTWLGLAAALRWVKAIQ